MNTSETERTNASVAFTCEACGGDAIGWPGDTVCMPCVDDHAARGDYDPAPAAPLSLFRAAGADDWSAEYRANGLAFEEHAAHGRTLTVRRVNRRSYVLRVDGSPYVRWASSRREVAEDVAHFRATGALPPPSGASWA